MPTPLFSDVSNNSNPKLPFSISKDSFDSWIAELETDNQVETLTSLLSVLTNIKQEAIKADLRFFFLQKISPLVEQLSLQCQKSYKRSSFPFSKFNNLKIELSANCAKEIANNYKLLCEDQSFKLEKVFTQQQKALAICNGIQFQAKVLLYESLLYKKAEPGFWSLCFLFYLFAQQNDILDLNVEFSEASFIQTFKKILLFEMSNVQQFNTEELLTVFYLLSEFSNQATLISEVPKKKFRGIPYINLRADAPPSLPTENVPQQQPFLYYISSLNVIKQLLQCLSNKPSLVNYNKTTLLRLIKALTMNQQRKSDRENSGDNLYAIIGFNKVKNYLLETSKAKKRKAQPAPEKIDDLDFDIQQVAEKNSNADELRSEREANLTILTNPFEMERIESSDIWSIEPQPSKKQFSRPVPNIGVVDRSATGYRLRLKDIETKVGEIIAVSISEHIIIAVVRRIIQIEGNEIQIGVEVLANDVELVNVIDTENDRSVIALYFQGGEDDMESIIIGTEDFEIGEFLFTSINEKMIRFRVEKQLYMSSTIRHLQVSVS